MRLLELFEDSNTSQKERAFQDAWTAARPMLKAKSIPSTYHGKVQSRAHELAMSYGMDVDDSISTAASEIGAKISKASVLPVSQQSQQSRKIDTPYADRIKQSKLSKSGKRWGNQYYSDPANSGGIKGSFASNKPGAIAKKALSKVDQQIGKSTDLGKALGGNLNKNSRRKR